MRDFRFAALIGVVAGAVALAACGGDEGDSSRTSISATATASSGLNSTTPTPNKSPQRESGEALIGPGLWKLKPDSPSSALQRFVDRECQGGGDEVMTAAQALEALGQSQFNIWEYWKAARLYDLANAQIYEACGALAPPANPGFILPLPPTTLIEALQTNSFKSESCQTLAQQMSGLYAAITKDVEKPYVYFEIQPNLRPLEQRWEDECE
ncbi:MAG TPA: hypothetical protein VLS25_07415 [Dehalococcoidia bacterium]|nr:hypothetical protein [Dehalococcoidia bacterium]